MSDVYEQGERERESRKFLTGGPQICSSVPPKNLMFSDDFYGTELHISKNKDSLLTRFISLSSISLMLLLFFV